MEITKDNARTLHPADLLANIDEWLDFLIENRNEVTFEHKIGFWELTINFPGLYWVPGVTVTAYPYEHAKIWEENEGDYHQYLLDKARDVLKEREVKRLKNQASGPLTPFDWLNYADGEAGD